MVIDAHYHLVEDGFLHDAWWQGIGRIYIGVAQARGRSVAGDPLAIGKAAAEATLYDPGGARLLAEMDAAGVDKTVLLALDYGLRTGEPLVPIFTIDPRREGAYDAFVDGVEEGGMRGLKFHCSAGFFPHDELCYPFYDYCQAHGLPVLLHTGNQPPPMKARYTMPVHVDDVAADFGDLKIVCAHLAFAWHDELISLAAVKPNIYMDFSGWQRSFLADPNELLGVLRRIIDELGAHRVFWGTDGPYLNVLIPVASWRHDFEKAARESGFSEDEISQLMGNAAAAVYGGADA